MSESTKKTTGMSTDWPGFSSCSVKQKHWILLNQPAVALGRDVVGRGADDRPLREVGGAEEDELLLAEMDLDLALHRLEAPGQVGVDVGVEAHLDGAGDTGRSPASATSGVPSKPVALQKAS